jgi:hypothetical protein
MAFLDDGAELVVGFDGVVATSNRKPPLRILICPLIRPWPALKWREELEILDKKATGTENCP